MGSEKGAENSKVGAVKYISRAGKKSAEEELTDLKKAAWYLARHIAKLAKQKEKIDEP